MTDDVQGIRKERVVGYSRMVLRMLIDAARQVFTGQYAEKQFRDLRITTEYPLTRNDYPAIYIIFHEDTLKRAGIGHKELFYDANGVLREWEHRLFTGSIEFQAFGLSALDARILGDAIVEMLAFGQLPTSTLQSNFFARLYNYEDYLSVLAHVALNTDEIEPGGESASPNPWGAENQLIYQKSYSVDIHGGFYNSTPDQIVPGKEFVDRVFLYPHLMQVVGMPTYLGQDEDWVDHDDGAVDIDESFTVVGIGSPSAVETYAPGT